MEKARTIKKGEHIYKVGERALSLQYILSGSVQVYLPRPKQNIEIFVVGTNQILGEQVLFGNSHHTLSAVATSECKVLEISSEGFRKLIDEAPQMVKLFSKSLTERVKFLLSEVKTARLERDTSPCPPDQVPKAFGVFFHVAKHFARPNPKASLVRANWASEPSNLVGVTVDWKQMKTYAQRVFMESPKRLEQVLNIFIKMKMVRTEMVKSEDDPKAIEELGFIHFEDLSFIEHFFLSTISITTLEGPKKL